MPDGDDGERDRAACARRARRRADRRGAVAHPDRRARRPGGARGADDAAASVAWRGGSRPTRCARLRGGATSATCRRPGSSRSRTRTTLRAGASGRSRDVEAMAETCRELDLSLHLDGARLFNAAVASGVEPSVIAGHADTVDDLLLEGARLPARRDRRGLGGAHGACTALQAPVRRRHAAGRDRRGRLRVRTRSQRRPAGRGPRTCPPAGRGAARGGRLGRSRPCRDELRPARRRRRWAHAEAMRPSGWWQKACACPERSCRACSAP